MIVIAQALLIIGLVASIIGARLMHGRPYPRSPFNGWSTMGIAAVELLLCLISWGWIL